MERWKRVRTKSMTDRIWFGVNIMQGITIYDSRLIVSIKEKSEPYMGRKDLTENRGVGCGHRQWSTTMGRAHIIFCW